MPTYLTLLLSISVIYAFCTLTLIRNKMIHRLFNNYFDVAFSSGIIEYNKIGGTKYSNEKMYSCLHSYYQCVLMFWKWEMKDFIKNENVYNHVIRIYRSNKEVCDFIVENQSDPLLVVDYLNRLYNDRLN